MFYLASSPQINHWVNSWQTLRSANEGRLDSPRLAEPVAHDSHHAGPDGWLQQAVQHPQAAVQIDVVDVEPFSESAKHKLLQTYGFVPKYQTNIVHLEQIKSILLLDVTKMHCNNELRLILRITLYKKCTAALSVSVYWRWSSKIRHFIWRVQTPLMHKVRPAKASHHRLHAQSNTCDVLTTKAEPHRPKQST